MRVALFGLGYVGSVCAAGLAARGHDVLGVDTAAFKVDAINSGRSPVVEPGLDVLVREQVASGRLRATTDGPAAVAASEISLICVGTPSEANGSLSTTALSRVVSTIGSAFANSGERHTVVVRSTMLPGTAEELLIPLLEQCSGQTVGDEFGFAVNPEFLREGSSLADFNDPVKTVIGEYDSASGDQVLRLYASNTGTVVRLSLRGAELAKYVDNAFHAIKVTFANEIGAMCHAFGLDSHDVMRSFFADTRLNISPAYLTPGFAFGGSCLPKDLRAMLYQARRHDLDLPLLESVLPSNESCISRVLRTVLDLGQRRVGILGLSFKSGTDDLRDSPFVELSERLLGKGCDLKIYDPQVSLSQLVGANRDYINRRLPHLSALLTGSADEVIEHSEVCIVCANEEGAIRALTEANGRIIVDLIRLPNAEARRGQGGYIGVAW